METPTYTFPHEHIARHAVVLLCARGFAAAWEYPGYISVRVSGGFLAYGFDDGLWYGHIESDHGECHGEIADLPIDASALAIADLLAASALAIGTASVPPDCN